MLFRNDNIILTSPIVTDDIKSSKKIVNMGRWNIFVSIFKQEKEQLVPKIGVNLSMDH